MVDPPAARNRDRITKEAQALWSVFPTIAAFVLFTFAPGATLFALGIFDVPLLISVTIAAVAVLVVIAHRIASGQP